MLLQKLLHPLHQLRLLLQLLVHGVGDQLRPPTTLPQRHALGVDLQRTDGGSQGLLRLLFGLSRDTPVSGECSTKVCVTCQSKISHQRQRLHLFIHPLGAGVQHVPPPGHVHNAVSQPAGRVALVPARLSNNKRQCVGEDDPGGGSDDLAGGSTHLAVGLVA